MRDRPPSLITTFLPSQHLLTYNIVSQASCTLKIIQKLLGTWLIARLQATIPDIWIWILNQRICVHLVSSTGKMTTISWFWEVLWVTGLQTYMYMSIASTALWKKESPGKTFIKFPVECVWDATERSCLFNKLHSLSPGTVNGPLFRWCTKVRVKVEWIKISCILWASTFLYFSPQSTINLNSTSCKSSGILLSPPLPLSYLKYFGRNRDFLKSFCAMAFIDVT